MKYTIVITTLLLLVLASCTPKDKELDVDPDIVLAFSYPEKSYWIFKDSASGKFDSLALVHASKDIINLTHETSMQYNSIFREYYNQVIDTAYWQLYLANDGSNNRVELQIFLEPASSDTVATTNYKLLLRPAKMVTNTHTNQVNQTEFLPSVIINNHQFDSVYHVRYYLSDGSKPDEHFYFNKKIGFIKYVQRSLRFNRTLELERWYVPR